MTAHNTSLEGWKKYFTLMLCCVSVLLVGIDMTAVNVALPAVKNDFQVDFDALTWVIGAYTLPLAAFLLLSSSLADAIGRKRVFLLGLVLFLIGSVLCGIAPDFTWLLIARAFQGLGASMLNPVAMAILAQTFPSLKERTWAMGIWAGVTGIALAIGPLVGGIMVTSSLGWRYIFFINVPVGLMAIALITWIVPTDNPENAKSIDTAGQGLMILCLASTTYALMEGEGLGWTNSEIITAFLMAILSLAGFIFWENKAAEPMLRLRFFRSIPFSFANLIAIFAFASLATFLYLNSIYLQQERGFSAFYTGVLMLPLAVCSVIYGPVSGRILSRYGPRMPLVIAGAGFFLTSIILAMTDSQTNLAWLILAYAVMGIANASVGAPITYMAISGMPPAQTSLAAGVSSTSRQIGQTFGIAVTGILMADIKGTELSDLSGAISMGWRIMGGYGMAIILMGFLATTQRALRTSVKNPE